MIAYFDTSALIPLMVDEPGSSVAQRLWDEAEHVVAVRLLYVEARAALAQACRMGRIDSGQLSTLVGHANALYEQLDRMDIDEVLIRRAGDLAHAFELRGYDAVHLAAAERLAGPDLVIVAGDGPLLAAATDLGLSIARTA